MGMLYTICNSFECIHAIIIKYYTHRTTKNGAFLHILSFHQGIDIQQWKQGPNHLTIFMLHRYVIQCEGGLGFAIVINIA